MKFFVCSILIACCWVPLVVGQDVAEPVEPVEVAWLPGYGLRLELRVASNPVGVEAKTVIATLPVGCWIDESQAIVVQSSAGDILPVKVLAHDPGTDTLIQFARAGDATTYFAYLRPAAGAVPPKLTVPASQLDQAKEGLFAQVREWNGDSLDDWDSVREAMVAGRVLGHAPVSEIAHYSNPAQPNHYNRFALSYRGFLNIDESGTYRMAINGDHALFLFIDDQMVFQRPGAGGREGGRKISNDFGVDVALTTGIHRVEYHQAVGDGVNAIGVGQLLWRKPGNTKAWSVIPREAFAQPLLAEVVGLSHAKDKQAAMFVYGIKDHLPAAGFDVLTVRFEAHGQINNPDALRWDFGDGQQATGRSVTHLYLEPGEYTVRLSGGQDPKTYERRIAVWVPPFNSSPLALPRAVELISQMDLSKADPLKLGQMFVLLLESGQPNRWPIIDRVARELLSKKGLDIEYRAQLYIAQIEAMGRQNRAIEAVQLADKVVGEFDRIDSLAASILLTAADVQRDHAGELQDASSRYQAILEKYRRIESTAVRRAAIHLGDLQASVGDFDAALESYETASQLGGSAYDKSVLAAATDIGANLRVVEQKLRDGDTRFAKSMLASIEFNYPQQKIEGFYQLLSGEVDRAAGRYDEALKAYQLVLAWPQWSGLRDRALRGGAVCAAELGRYDDALRYLELLEKTERAFFEENDLSAYRREVEVQKQLAESGMTPRPFAGVTFDFESIEPTPEVQTGLPIERAMGITGGGVLWSGNGDTKNTYSARLNLPKVHRMSDAAEYRIDYWYRNSMGNTTASGRPSIHTIAHPTAGMAPIVIQPWPVWGQWIYAGGYSAAPQPDIEVVCINLLSARMQGLTQFDEVKISPVTVQQRDALLNFLQGDTQP